MIITPELWMYINLGSLALILILALLSFRKDPTLELLTRALILIVRLERRRISQDPEGKGTDPGKKTSSMVSTPTEGHNPSQEEEDLLREMEEKLRGLL